MKHQATKTPRCNNLEMFDLAMLERVPAYRRVGVTVTEVGQTIHAVRRQQATAATPALAG